MSATGPTAVTLPSVRITTVVASLRHLGDGVADIEDGHAHLVAQALDVGQDLGAPRLVERGQRLVHQQELRMGEQGAADRDPLLLAARQRGGAPFQQMADAQQIDDRGEIGSACRRLRG